MSDPAVSPAPMETFDVCGPLPTGTTLLEASAGTGKTFTVAGLVTRYVAEGLSLPEGGKVYGKWPLRFLWRLLKAQIAGDVSVLVVES